MALSLINFNLYLIHLFRFNYLYNDFILSFKKHYCLYFHLQNFLLIIHLFIMQFIIFLQYLNQMEYHHLNLITNLFMIQYSFRFNCSKHFHYLRFIYFSLPYFYFEFFLFDYYFRWLQFILMNLLNYLLYSNFDHLFVKLNLVHSLHQNHHFFN